MLLLLLTIMMMMTKQGKQATEAQPIAVQTQTASAHYIICCLCRSKSNLFVGNTNASRHLRMKIRQTENAFIPGIISLLFVWRNTTAMKTVNKTMR